MRLVLVGGHESDGGADLVRFERLLPGAIAVGAGRRLDSVVRHELGHDGIVVVVPMTFGRDPTMVADTAKTLRWIATKHRGAVALAAPFGVADHLTAQYEPGTHPPLRVLVNGRDIGALDDRRTVLGEGDDVLVLTPIGAVRRGTDRRDHP